MQGNSIVYNIEKRVKDYLTRFLYVLQHVDYKIRLFLLPLRCKRIEKWRAYVTRIRF